MADDIELNAGAGGDTVAADEIGGVKHQRVKVQHGADGAATDVSTASPLPVDVRSDNAGGLEVVQDTAADLNMTEANSAAALALLTTIDADTGAIKTAIQLLDNCITGNEAQVDIVAELPAGNQNIGNVDIVTLPAGNLGMQAMAASLSIVPANNITDATYIGDIKFGEAEPNSAAIKTALELLDNAVDGNYLNVNLNAAGTDLSMNAGVLTAQTMRVTIATDDEVNNLLGTIDADTGAIKTAVEIIDDWDESDRAKINPIAGQAGIAANAGNMDALTTRVVIATNDTHFGTVGAASDIDGVVHGQLRYIADQLVTIDSDTNDIKTAVEIIDDWDDGSDHCETVDANTATLGTTTYAEGTTKGPVVGAVRNDDKATLANTDNEIAPLQVDSEGALYTNAAAAENKSASGVAAGGAPGTDDMIAAVAGKKLLITAMSLTATSTTTNSVFVDNVDNDLYGNTGNPIPLSMDADGDTIPGIVLPYNPAGWFKTDTVNEAVTLNSSAAQDIIWSISWIETD